MDDFLHRLYRLAKSSKRTPREDFLSLCVGRQLEADPCFATGFMLTIAKCTRKKSLKKSIRCWARTPEGDRSIEVRAQVPARTQHHERDGAVDLLLRLEGPCCIELIIEAKVGASVPAPSQLERYAEAFPAPKESLSRAKVIGLVQKTESHRYPPGWRHITWDDVMAAIAACDDYPPLSRSRRELLDLLAEGGVGDTRLALPASAWPKVVEASNAFESKLPPKLKAMMVAMFPNDVLRHRVSVLFEDEDTQVECTNAWGVGFWVEHVPEGMRIKGLTLGIEEGAFHDEITWRLEVFPSNKPLRTWLGSEDAPSWWPVRNESGWFFTHLTTTIGPSNLCKADLEDVVRLGRIALKEIHREAGVAWHPRGDGLAPHAPRTLHIPTLREGIRQWSTVYQGLQQVALNLLTILGPQNDSKTPYRWDKDAWRSKGRLGKHDCHVRATVDVDLKSFYVELPEASDEAAARILTAMESHDAANTLVLSYDFSRRRVTWTLTPETWQDPKIASTLSTIILAGLEA